MNKLQIKIFPILVACLFSFPSIAQQKLPAPLEGIPSDVPVAVQVLRWHMLDNNVSALAFREMDQLFTTRSVARSGPVWELPRTDHAMDFSYSWQGSSYSAEDFLERTYTNALLVIKNGRIVTEIYRNNSTPQSRFIGWSMTKSITSVLIGCAMEDGYIDSLDTAISHYLPELIGGGYEDVSIRHVMQMRSGVDYEERYDFANPGIAASNHISSLVKNNSRFTDVAKTLTRLNQPGEVFQYKTIDTAVLGWLIERRTGMSTAAYTERCLWEPLGAEADGFYIMDGPPGTGREFSGAGFNATLRDYARVGQMVLNGGVANGQRIVSEDWIKLSTQPSGGEDQRRGGYGYQWWTMGNSEAFSAIGLQGQYIYIDPDTETVIVKLSYFPPGDNSAQDGETLAFMAAASRWQP
ncbi:beta-lactamase family protein [Gammaproteobacteria bacterium]|nr:beta-lactamase family protein [Gammaproteobacteria bacterium]